LFLESLELIVAISITITAFLLLLSSDWRLNIGLLGIQYLGLFILVAKFWPFLQAVSVLFSGWIACTVLGMAILSLSEENQRRNFRQAVYPLLIILTSIIVSLIMLTFAPQINRWIPTMNSIESWAALILIGSGLLRLAFNPAPIPMTIGLLTVLSGFEVLFAGLTSSQFSTGLLAAITLFIALAGAYLSLTEYMEKPA
jgi:hypothetical protein